MFPGKSFAGRGALERTAPQRRPQKRLDRRLEEVAEAVGGGYCRLQMPLRLPPAVSETVAGRRLGALEAGGGGGTSPPCKASLGGRGSNVGSMNPLPKKKWPLHIHCNTQRYTQRNRVLQPRGGNTIQGSREPPSHDPGSHPLATPPIPAPYNPWVAMRPGRRRKGMADGAEGTLSPDGRGWGMPLSLLEGPEIHRCGGCCGLACGTAGGSRQGH